MLTVLANPLVISQEFHDCLDQITTSTDSFFITGKAGTGKSTLLHILRNTTSKKTVVLAPTGIAALNVRGQTIHSFFGFPPYMLDPQKIVTRKKKKVYQEIEQMIIDEISMVRADMLDNIDLFLRYQRKNNAPFGGVQCVFFGDLFQLPPVVSSIDEKRILQTNYDSSYFFSAKVMQKWQICPIILQNIYRQKDKTFIQLLDNIRSGDVTQEDLDTLNQRVYATPQENTSYIRLCSRNNIADAINIRNLHALDTPLHTYNATIEGQFNTNQHPAEMSLKLKVGAQVMCIRNDTKRQYVNGTIGKIVDLAPDSIKIEINTSGELTKYVDIEKQEWEIIHYDISDSKPHKIDIKVIGKFIQYPIKLAWAVTIHKAQGKTFDHVIIDLGGGAFESGQTYVALSRCTSLEGIILAKPISTSDIILDEKVVEYFTHLRYYS